MLANYARIVRRSIALTAVIAAAMVAISVATGGTPGLIGALLGVALVAVFFGIDVVAIGRAARVSPQAVMLTAIVAYLFKIIGLAVVMVNLQGTTAFNTKLFGVTAIVCILGWCGAQVAASMKVETPYVEPNREL